MSAKPGINDAEVTTERELAEAAQWKLIQKNTFTRWTNERLKVVNKHLTELTTDLSDGLRLIALVEVLSGKRFHKYNKRPTFRTHKLENVTMALKFLQHEEGIKIVNIDSSDIVDGHLKLILGLIWTLILHYSISVPMWDDDDNPAYILTTQSTDQTPKMRLLAWIQNKIPDRPITNFTTDWNDGKAIGALVDAIAPGLCPDWEDWDPMKPVPNATEAMNAAEKWLEVPQLIQPAEMCNPRVDELSIMTYLSQFPNSKLLPGAPLRPRINPKRVRVYGPGVEPKGHAVGALARFTVETFSAGKGDLSVQLINSKGQAENIECVFNNDRHLTYSCSYVPTVEGKHEIHVSYSGRTVPKSPYQIEVKGVAGDPNKVTATGPGLSKSGNIVSKKTYFQVSTKGAGTGAVDVNIRDPRGSNLRTVTRKLADDLWQFDYTASLDGMHVINIYFAGKLIPQCPHNILIEPAVDASKCYVKGRGIQTSGLRVGETVEFTVHTADAGGPAKLDVNINTSSGTVPVSVTQSSSDPSVYHCTYTPTRPDSHVINVKYAERDIPRSPFKVNIKDKTKCGMYAWGPGLQYGVVGYPAKFTVETNGERGTLGFSIEGSSQAKIDCHDNEDGSADVAYYPVVPGDYVIHVLCDDEDIKDSPFVVPVVADNGAANPNKVTAHGKGLASTGVVMEEQTEFFVDVPRDAGVAKLSVVGMDIDSNPMDISMDMQPDRQTGNKRYTCRYTPKRNVKHVISICYGGIAVPSSPFRIAVEEASRPDRVKVFGPAFKDKVFTNEKTHFVVDCASAGPGDVAIALTDEKGQDIIVDTSDNSDNTFTVEFSPKTPGRYTANVYFGEHEIPISPLHFTVNLSPAEIAAIEAAKAAEKARLEHEAAEKARLEREAAEKARLEREAAEKARLEREAAEKARLEREAAEKARLEREAAEKARLEREAAEKARLEREAAEKARLEHEAAERARLEREAAEKARLEREAAEKLRLELEAAEKARLEREAAEKIRIEREAAEKLRAEAEAAEKARLEREAAEKLRLELEAAEKARLEREAAEKIRIEREAAEKLRAEAEAAEKARLEREAAEKARLEREAAEKARLEREAAEKARLEREAAEKLRLELEAAENARLEREAAERARIEREAAEKIRAELEAAEKARLEREAAEKARQEREAAEKLRLELEVAEKARLEREAAEREAAEIARAAEEEAERERAELEAAELAAAALRDERSVLMPVCFNLPVGPVIDLLEVKVHSPSGSVTTPHLVNNNDCTAWIHFDPVETGLHSLQLKYDGHVMEGMPIKFEVEEQNVNYPHVTGAGLTTGVVGRAAEFSLHSTTFPSRGLLVVTVEGPSKCEISAIEQDDSFDISYVPNEIGEYVIGITHCDQHIRGSPFTAKIFSSYDSTRSMPSALNKEHFVSVFKHDRQTTKSRVFINGQDSRDGNQTASVGPDMVTAGGDGLNNGHLNAVCKFWIDVSKAGSGELHVMVEGPSNAEVKYLSEKNGVYDCVYKPSALGRYVISVRYAGQNIPGSPYLINVLNNEVTTFSVSDRSISHCGTECTVFLKLPEDMDMNDVMAVVLNPIGVTEGCSIRRLKRRHRRDSVRSPTSPLSFQLESASEPSSSSPTAAYGVTFVPRRMGVHTINIYNRNEQLSDSPYRFVIGPAGGLTMKDERSEFNENQNGANVDMNNENDSLQKILDIKNSSLLVSACGAGLTSGVADVENTVQVSIPSSVVGVLSACMNGPGCAQVTVSDTQGVDRSGNRIVNIDYMTKVPGDYQLSVYFNDHHIQNSPFTLYVAPPENEENLVPKNSSVIPSGSRLQEAGRPVCVKVWAPSELGPLRASVTAPSGSMQEAYVQDLDKDLYGLRFIPREIGCHEVKVIQNEQPIRASPVYVSVGKPAARAAMITTSGSGLSSGAEGKECVFLVDARKAGPEDILINIEGPGKASVHYEQTTAGLYQVSYSVPVSGSYTLNVKYGGKHQTPGSPFQIKVDGRSVSKAVWKEHTRMILPAYTGGTLKTNESGVSADRAGGVCCVGTGLQRVFVNNRAVFIVDASSSGKKDHKLDVRIFGPKGPCEDVSINRADEGQGRGLYSVSYRPVSRGNHSVIVLLDDSPVDGSPFLVDVQ